MRKISACIVCYTGADEVLRAVESVLRHTGGCGLQVYLVDNASPDGAGEALEQAAKDPGSRCCACPGTWRASAGGTTRCCPCWTASITLC